MNVTVVGSIPRDTQAVAVVGTWEPFVPFHAELLARLRAHAAAEGLLPVAIMFDPPPTMLQEGEAKWPLFHDAAARTRCLREHGIEATVLVRFTPEDLGKAARDFFEAVSAPLHIAEFWLRDRQILGQREGGSRLAIAVQCVKRQVKLTKLPPEPVRELAMQIRAHLAAGEVRAASAVAGQSPVRYRPDEGASRLAWLPGSYEAIAHADADAGGYASRDARPMLVELTPTDGGMCTLAWPDDAVERLTFVSGPGDAMLTAMAPSAREAACA